MAYSLTSNVLGALGHSLILQEFLESEEKGEIPSVASCHKSPQGATGWSQERLLLEDYATEASREASPGQQRQKAFSLSGQSTDLDGRG